MKSKLEEALLSKIVLAGLPLPVREYQFERGRRWRFDFAWPEFRLAVEVEGGVFSNGRHVRGVGFEQDCYKYNCAVARGWRVLRYTGKMVKGAHAIRQIAEVIGGKP